MKKQTIASLAMIALCGFALAGQKDSDKREGDKNAPRKIEITGETKRIRVALIDAELAEGWKLESEEENQIRVTRPVSTWGEKSKAITGLQLWYRDTFTLTDVQ